MNLIVLFPLLAIVSAKTKIHPNAVNLALETSLIFDDSNTKKDLSFIDGLQNFLNKLKSYLKVREQTSFRSQDRKGGIFTDFFRDFSRIIINYDSEVLKNLTDALALVMEPYYKKTTFHKIIEDEKLKSFVKDKIIDWADTDPKLLKYQMAIAVMSKEITPLTELGSYLNRFFSEKDSKRLKKLLKKFNKHEKPTDMHKLVKNALDFLVFHRFHKLNETAKNDLSKSIKKVTDVLLSVQETPIVSSPKNDYPTHKKNKTYKDGNFRRFQVRRNSVLPKKIILNNNVEFNVRTQQKEEKKELVADIVTENKGSTKPVKVKKWEIDPYISMEVKLNDDKQISVETEEHDIDTAIIDSKHLKKINKNGQLNTNTKLGMVETDITYTETLPDKDDTEVTTIASKDNSTLVDLYKHIMSINIEGKNETKVLHRDVENNKDTEHEYNDTQHLEFIALVQNSDDKNVEEKALQTVQDETNKITAHNVEIKGKERKMGKVLQMDPPHVYVTEPETETEELKREIDRNPRTSATARYLDDSSTLMSQDEAASGGGEEYQSKIADGAKKISNLLDSAIAMKLLGIT